MAPGNASARRFAGAVQDLFASIDIGDVLSWIAAIPFEDWPQQDRLPDGKLRPAMVNDPAWHGFGDVVTPLIVSVMPLTLEALGRAEAPLVTENQMLSVVMPGASIPPHVDRQSPRWLARVHVPIQTGSESLFIVEGESHAMIVGGAYLVNPEREHEIRNLGPTPRIHLMWDVMETK